MLCRCHRKGGNIFMSILEEKANLEKKLQEINDTVSREDIENATTDELKRYLQLNLQIKEKLEIIDAISNS